VAKPKPVRLVLAGIGGMGACYLDELFDHAGDRPFELTGAVDPSPRRSRQAAALEERGVPVYPSLEDFYGRHQADLAIISSPIHFHSSQTLEALARGSHVLCEKPAAALIQEVRRMAEAAAPSGRFAAVGYQWSFSRAIQDLKADVRAGVFGRPKRLRCLYLWPRDETYYGRNDWAGRIRNASGQWILDSPANNAMAHDLHNMLYILGPATDRSAEPARVTAELYRAYPIQNYDTVAARVITRDDVELLIYFSHACAADIGPVISYEFEEATVLGSGRGSSLKAVHADGRITEYGPPDDEPFKKLWDCLAAVRTGDRPVCGLEAAASQTLCVNGFQESHPISSFPARFQEREGKPGSRWVYVRGLEETFVRCYQGGKLPSEMGVDWAQPGREVELTDYPAFPSSKTPAA
jgi:predicted dehydrogenase